VYNFISTSLKVMKNVIG